MIQYIKGSVAFLEADKAVIDVNGIGYGVFMPARVLNRIGIGEILTVYTYFSVREDAMQLYGFLNRDDLDMFKLLLNVNGIGPKGAISVLSALSADDIRFAVMADDVKTISSAPGIGKKTAQKLILELKDKVDLAKTLEHSINKAQEVSDPAILSVKADAIEILEQWGYSASEALKAINQLEHVEALSVEEILQQALKLLK